MVKTDSNAYISLILTETSGFWRSDGPRILIRGGGEASMGDIYMYTTWGRLLRIPKGAIPMPCYASLREGVGLSNVVSETSRANVGNAAACTAEWPTSPMELCRCQGWDANNNRQ